MLRFRRTPEYKTCHSCLGCYWKYGRSFGKGRKRTKCDISAEIERLDKQLAATLAEIERGEKLLANKGFVAKAPKALIDKETAKLAANRQKADDIRRQADALKD